MYLYPENLKAKATLWFWKIKDLGIFSGLLLFGLLVLVKSGVSIFLIAGAVYAFLTIQIEDMSIKDFIIYACKFFMTDQQRFEWRRRSEKDKK